MTGTIWAMIGLVIGAYLLGGILFAKIFSSIKGGELLKKDSGNPGAMNMVRNYGVWLGLATLVCDALKAAIPALIGYFILGDLGLYIGGVAAMIGHLFPVYHRFKGGKGFSCSVGIFAVANPIVGIPLFVFALAMICVTKQGALCDLCYLLIMGIVETFMCEPVIAVYVIIWLIVVLGFWSHRSNIKRILTGTENKTQLGKEIKKAFSSKPKETKETQANTQESEISQERIEGENNE